jgi:hypothetical protein
MTTAVVDLEPSATRDVRPKQLRLSWAHKLQHLDPVSSSRRTERRLEAFCHLFAYRRRDGIVTRIGEGPRAWTALRGPVTTVHIVRHLLADRAESLSPQWIGCRSFPSSRFVCLDVDAERASTRTVTNQSSIRPGMRRPSFLQRCVQVEQALKYLGVNARVPNQVLIQNTPSGGRHYYVFFDGLYELEDYRMVLEGAGLRFQKGSIELFPSCTQGLRLPFGFNPNQPHDPKAWIQFIDRYRRGEIKLFSLSKMRDRLCEDGPRQSKRTRRPDRPSTTSANRQPVTSSPTIDFHRMGTRCCQR